MKVRLILLLLLSFTMAFLIGCGGGNTAVSPTSVPMQETAVPADGANQVEAPRATITPETSGATAPGDGYPPPAPPVVDGGYPFPAPAAPSNDAYPLAAGHIWMSRAAGEQCAEVAPLTLSEAVAELQGAGITAQEPHTVNLLVCTACGCPTSLHFWVQVPQESIATAESLGWEVVEQN